MNSSPTPGPQNFLAVYGTLAPGRLNYLQVQRYGGHWSKAWVHGTVQEDQGYPVFIYDPKASELEVDLLESPRIDWEALDKFEGSNYRRILVPLRQGEVTFLGNIYAWAKSFK